MSAPISGAASPSLDATGPHVAPSTSSLAGAATTLADANSAGPVGPGARGATPAGAGDDVAFDIAAESAPDSAAALSQAVIKRAEMFMLAQHLRNQDQQARLDRMRGEFDNAQARRAELLRESNALRDMALEQMKHDDEVLKKIISWI